MLPLLTKVFYFSPSSEELKGRWCLIEKVLTSFGRIVPMKLRRISFEVGLEPVANLQQDSSHPLLPWLFFNFQGLSLPFFFFLFFFFVAQKFKRVSLQDQLNRNKKAAEIFFASFTQVRMFVQCSVITKNFGDIDNYRFFQLNERFKKNWENLQKFERFFFLTESVFFNSMKMFRLRQSS